MSLICPTFKLQINDFFTNRKLKKIELVTRPDIEKHVFFLVTATFGGGDHGSWPRPLGLGDGVHQLVKLVGCFQILALTQPGSNQRINQGVKQAIKQVRETKIIDVPGGQINDPLSGKNYSIPVLPAIPSSLSRILEGLFELKQRPSRVLNWPRALLPELRKNKDTIKCGALGAQVPIQLQEQLTKTLIVRLLKTHLFS